VKLESLLEAIPKQRSLNSFIRRASGVKGKTEHSGRGAWILMADDNYDWEAMVQRLLNKLTQWKRSGLLVDAARSDKGLVLVFSPRYFNPHYRTFVTNRPTDNRLTPPSTLGAVTFSMENIPGLSMPVEDPLDWYITNKGYQRIRL